MTDIYLGVVNDIIIHAINVGQGDSFLVQVSERGTSGYFHKSGFSEYRNYLIDGGNGSKEHMENLKQCLTTITIHSCAIVSTDKILDESTNELNLDCIIATHPDEDHIKGLTQLLNEHEYSGAIMITDAFAGKRTAEELIQIICGSREWEQPLRPCQENDTKTVKWYNPKSKGRVYTQSLFDKFNPKEVKLRTDTSHLLKKEDSVTTKHNTNITSILTVIKDRCVFTGDSCGDLITDHILRNWRGTHISFQPTPHVSVFQVPHHGSKDNSKCNEGCHLQSKVQEKIQNFKAKFKHTNDQKKKTISCIEFYSQFTASIYLISGGGHDGYDHPHAEVLQAIIIANVIQKNRCQIVITNSKGLDAEKLSDLKFFLQNKKWSKWVTICHANDLPLDSVKSHIQPQTHVTIHLDKNADVDEDKDASYLTPNDQHPNIWRAIKWSPDGYEKMFDLEANKKSILAPQLDGLFSRKVTLLCMPVPHKPWKGREVNLCYKIVGESRCFQVEVDTVKQKLKYQMFKYLDEEWSMDIIRGEIGSLQDTNFPELQEKVKDPMYQLKMARWIEKQHIPTLVTFPALLDEGQTLTYSH